MPPELSLHTTAAPSATGELGVYACPVCKRLLRQEKGALRCTTCSQAYPISEGIPDFILEELAHRDRKSTRLNSSHLGISYAVFCLKKRGKTSICAFVISTCAFATSAPFACLRI